MSESSDSRGALRNSSKMPRFRKSYGSAGGDCDKSSTENAGVCNVGRDDSAGRLLGRLARL